MIYHRFENHQYGDEQIICVHRRKETIAIFEKTMDWRELLERSQQTRQWYMCHLREA